MQRRGRKEELQAPFFVGHKDKTLTDIIRTGKKHRTTVTEEHVVLIQVPGSQYPGHVSPVSGSAEFIKTYLKAFRTLTLKQEPF